jgi:DNA-binding transcriptional LysR family regulator
MPGLDPFQVHDARVKIVTYFAGNAMQRFCLAYADRDHRTALFHRRQLSSKGKQTSCAALYGRGRSLMELRQLETFAEIARAGSFTQAAENLSLTQPAVTRQIGALERELKVRLFDRLGRRVTLTSAGQVLEEYARRIIGTAADAQRAVADVAAGASGRLAVGASTTAATYLLPPALGRFRDQHPAVDLSVLTGPSTRISEMVLANAVDLGIVMDLDETPGLYFVPLADYRTVIVTYPDHPLAVASPAHPTDGVEMAALADRELILMQPGATLRGLVEDLLAGARVSGRVSMELDSVEAIKRMVRARLGISILPEVAVASEVEAGALAALPIREMTSSSQKVSAVYRNDKYLSAALKAFVEVLKEEMA